MTQNRNPFLENITPRILRKETRTIETSRVTDGASLIQRELTKFDPIEIDEFVRLFLFDKYKGLAKEFTPSGCKLLLSIFSHLKKDQDYVIIDREFLRETYGWSQVTISNGINNLKDLSLISKRSQKTYWINPEFMFKGNRKQYYMDNIPDKINWLKDFKPTVINLTDNKQKSDKQIILR